MKDRTGKEITTINIVETEKGLRDMAKFAPQFDKTLLAAADICKRMKEIKDVMLTTSCASVEDLNERYLSVLERLNAKNRPYGFESWEDYHKHIISISNNFDIASAVNQDLSTALTRVLASAKPNKTEHPSMYAAWAEGEKALAKAATIKMDIKVPCLKVSNIKSQPI